jgi:hypothetical protein
MLADDQLTAKRPKGSRARANARHYAYHSDAAGRRSGVRADLVLNTEVQQLVHIPPSEGC